MDINSAAENPPTSIKKYEDFAEKTVDFAGFHGKIKAGQRPLSTRWMSDKLIADTRRVWSEYLAKPVSEAEAIEILTNVRYFALALIIEDNDQGEIYVSPSPSQPKERSDLGARLLPRTT